MKKKQRWFKRVISGALAFAVFATTLFGGLDNGLIAYALQGAKWGYTNLMHEVGNNILNEKKSPWKMHEQALVKNEYEIGNGKDYSDKLKSVVPIFCIQKGTRLGSGTGAFDKTTPDAKSPNQKQQELIQEIIYWANLPSTAQWVSDNVGMKTGSIDAATFANRYAETNMIIICVTPILSS